MRSADGRKAGSIDRLLVAAFIFAWLFALLPIWRPRFLPLFDFPAHLVHIAIWHRLDDPGWHYQDFYQRSLHVVPYWGYWFPVHLLSYLLPVETANKIYLSLHAAALPASLIVLGRRFGRSPWIALFGFPLVFNFAFSFGFIGYSMSCALANVTLSHADACLERTTPARLAGLLLLALVTYFTHFLPWLLMGLCFAALLVSRRPPLARALPVGAVLLATAIFAAVNYHFAARANLYGISEGNAGLAFRAEPPLAALRQIPSRILIGWPGRADEILLATLLGAAIALVVTARRRGGPAIRSDRLPLYFAGIALAGHLIVPFYLLWPVHWWNAGGRLVTPAALFLVLSLRGPIVGRDRSWMAPVMLVCALYPMLLSDRFVDFDSRMAGMARLLEKVPRGRSTLTLSLGDPGDPALDPWHTPYRGAHSYPQLLAGGYDAYQYRNNFPFRAIESRRLPAPPWLAPEQLTADQAAHHDFVLTRNEETDGQLLRAAGAPVRLVGHDGAWRLYATGRTDGGLH